MNWRTAADVARDVVRVLRENNITFMAGSIAHAAFLSLLPLLLLLLILTAAVGQQALNEQIAAFARDYLSPTGEDLVFTALTEASERAGASLLGVVTLLWGMLRVFRALSTAFDELYGEEFTGPLQQVVNGVVVFGVILLATVGSALGLAVLALGEHPLLSLLTTPVLVVGLLVAFFPMYYVFPEPNLEPREAVPGTVVAAVGWVALEVVFGLYVQLVNTVSLYGLLGSVILLLVWLYGIAFVLLVGGAVNVVLAGRHLPEAETETERVERRAREDAGEAAGEDAGEPTREPEYEPSDERAGESDSEADGDSDGDDESPDPGTSAR